jgi:hypothetical protein
VTKLVKVLAYTQKPAFVRYFRKGLKNTYIDEENDDCIHRDKRSHGVYLVAKFGAFKYSMVQRQNASFDEE